MQNDTSASQEPSLALEGWSPNIPAGRPTLGSLRERHPVLWDQGQVQRALLPGTLGAARKVVTTLPIMAPQFVGTLVLNHSQMT